MLTTLLQEVKCVIWSDPIVCKLVPKLLYTRAVQTPHRFEKRNVTLYNLRIFTRILSGWNRQKTNSLGRKKRYSNNKNVAWFCRIDGENKYKINKIKIQNFKCQVQFQYLWSHSSRTVFREWAVSELRGTDVQGQISKHIFAPTEAQFWKLGNILGYSSVLAEEYSPTWRVKTNRARAQILDGL